MLGLMGVFVQSADQSLPRQAGRAAIVESKGFATPNAPIVMKLTAHILLCATLVWGMAPAYANEEAKPAAAKAEAPKVAKPDLAKGAASFGAVCAACHGADGNSGTPANPKLAQQHPDYLILELENFKSGKRASAVMKGFASALSDDDMRNIAYWLASQKAKPGFAKDKSLVALGERIYRGGIADRQVPACAGCHSPNGAGIPSRYPRLAGQHADYVAAQIAAFRDKARSNSVEMMSAVGKLNDREIKAVADYVAGLR